MLEFSSLLSGEDTELALLSTYQFDPDDFERRLLRQPALNSARRIAVLVDAREWARLHYRDVRAKKLNRRYLVVPVGVSNGVFHPKLSLLIQEQSVKVLCGSTNLTRSGCTSNLELINSLTSNLNEPEPAVLSAACETFGFFETATKSTGSGTGEILSKWLEESKLRHRWLGDEHSGNIRLVNLSLIHI